MKCDYEVYRNPIFPKPWVYRDRCFYHHCFDTCLSALISARRAKARLNRGAPMPPWYWKLQTVLLRRPSDEEHRRGLSIGGYLIINGHLVVHGPRATILRHEETDAGIADGMADLTKE